MIGLLLRVSVVLLEANRARYIMLMFKSIMMDIQINHIAKLNSLRFIIIMIMRIIVFVFKLNDNYSQC